MTTRKKQQEKNLVKFECVFKSKNQEKQENSMRM